MEAFEIVRIGLNDHIVNPKIDEQLISKWADVEVYAKLLQRNLEDIFETISIDYPSGNLQIIEDIEMPFRKKNIYFSIEIFNRHYENRYTAYCPELVGCITEGSSKIDALNNLCYAIAEYLILNSDILGLNPFSPDFSKPQVRSRIFIKSDDQQAYGFAKVNPRKSGFHQLFLSKKHLLLKNPNRPTVTLTLNNNGFQKLTLDLLNDIAGILPNVENRL